VTKVIGIADGLEDFLAKTADDIVYAPDRDFQLGPFRPP
jgi:hypothetical protein